MRQSWKTRSPDDSPVYSNHVVVMQALDDTVPTIVKDNSFSSERETPQKEHKLRSPPEVKCDKGGDNGKHDSKTKRNLFGEQPTQEALFCFGKKSKKKNKKKDNLTSESSENLSTVSSYDTTDTALNEEEESRTSSKSNPLKKETEDKKTAKTSLKSDKSDSKRKSDSISSEPYDVSKAKETIGWSELKTNDLNDATKQNMNNKTKKESYDKAPEKSTKLASGNTKLNDLVTPVRVFPGIGSQKRRQSKESDSLLREKSPERRSYPREDQSQSKKMDGKRKPDKFISVKAPRSATKVMTKRRYHIQIPEERGKDTWFNAHFNFNDDGNIDWNYEGPVKIKNYYSTSNYS